MKQPSFSPSGAGRRGVALVITLLMVAMLAFLVVAFFSRVTANRQIESSSNSGVRAEVLARSAAEMVISDLRSEIIAGSAPVPAGSTTPVYLPTTSQRMVPSRVVGTSLPKSPAVYVNVVKQSMDRFFPVSVGANPTPIVQATTGVPTSVASVNERTFSYSRWQTPMLAGLNAFTSPNTSLPQWVTITRGGVPSTQTWSSDLKDYTPGKQGAAIGRFAFNVYDTGGLMDINAASYPPVDPTKFALTPAEVQELKGTLTGAELVGPITSQPNIPGITDLTAFTSNWKYLTSGASTTKFMTQWRTTARSGFLRPGVGDNVAMGRQDLIRLAKKTTDPKVTSTAPIYGIDGTEDSTPPALPYLTHFSRESNAPSWFPAQDASAMGGSDGTAVGGLPAPYAYRTNANNALVPNRALSGVRVVGTFTRADGTQAVVGEPLVKTRLSLGRLAGLGLNGPVLTGPNTTLVNGVASQATAATVQRDFGLVWDTANNRWIYAGASGSTYQTTIKTLDEVANGTPKREPNFFELLKAGILSGSLGNSSDFESFCMNIGEDSNPDYQIIQIGANIIDQADSDSYPTQIVFGNEMEYGASSASQAMVTVKSATNTPTSTGEPKVFSGVEDIPYLQSVVATPYRQPAGQPNLALPPISPPSADTNQTAKLDYINCWMQFVLWKPQQPAVVGTGGSPTSFRVVCTSPGIKMIYYPAAAAGQFLYLNNVAQSTAPVLTSATVTFNDAPTSFRVPTLLGGMGATPDDGFNCSQPQGNGKNTNGGTAQLPRGMWMGETIRPEKDYNGGSPNQKDAPQTTHVEFRCQSPSRIDLEYQDSALKWHVYQRYDGFGVGTGSGFKGRGLFGFADSPYYQGSSKLPLGWPNYPAYQELDVSQFSVSAADPRSQRFGLMAMYLDGTSTAPYQNPDKFGDWRYYLKQGWWPTGSTGLSYKASFNPQNARFSPSWSGGTKNNSWSGHSSDSPITVPTTFFADNNGSGLFYKDPDGVTRRGDGDYPNDVKPMQLSSGTAPNKPALGIVINRPFRNVGELSYVFRDVPWKSLDLFSDKSADSGLVDLFSVAEQPAIIAGKVNLNTRNAVVLQAILAGALREEGTLTSASPNVVQSTTGGALSAKTMAENMVKNTSDTSNNPNTGPLFNVGDIAGRLAAILPVANGVPDQAIKTRREVIGRALAGVGQTHTWNLMVDVVAQSGRYPVTAGKLEQFVVEGEKRYWLHVAIDRLTGQVIDQQLESVNE